jgi:hypothetical protein
MLSCQFDVVACDNTRTFKYREEYDLINDMFEEEHDNLLLQYPTRYDARLAKMAISRIIENLKLPFVASQQRESVLVLWKEA